MRDYEIEYKYFEKMKIKPGLLFFDELSVCDLESLKNLNINIPSSLCIFRTSSWLYNSKNILSFILLESKGQGLDHRNDFILKHFYQRIVEIQEKYNGNLD